MRQLVGICVICGNEYKFPALVLKGVFTLRVVKTMNASLDCLPGN